MFGGDNNNPAMQPADPQGLPAVPATDGGVAQNGYDAGGYGQPADGAALPADPSQQMPAPAQDGAPDDQGTEHNPSMTPMDNTDDLVELKQQALQQLSPLVGHLDQTPEEKFRTTMMMIQASDNSELIKDAYAAAQQISDEKTRAQALLDVINEINYFTQHHDQQQ